MMENKKELYSVLILVIVLIAFLLGLYYFYIYFGPSMGEAGLSAPDIPPKTILPSNLLILFAFLM